MKIGENKRNNNTYNYIGYRRFVFGPGTNIGTQKMAYILPQAVGGISNCMSYCLKNMLYAQFLCQSDMFLCCMRTKNMTY